MDDQGSREVQVQEAGIVFSWQRALIDSCNTNTATTNIAIAVEGEFQSLFISVDSTLTHLHCVPTSRNFFDPFLPLLQKPNV